MWFWLQITSRIRVYTSDAATEGGRASLTTACAPISVYLEYFVETLRNDKTTSNDGKRSNIV